MTPDQWFTLWMTLLSVVGGGTLTLLGVYFGAFTALRNQRRTVIEDQQRAIIGDVHRSILRITNCLERGKYMMAKKVRPLVARSCELAEAIPSNLIRDDGLRDMVDLFTAELLDLDMGLNRGDISPPEDCTGADFPEFRRVQLESAKLYRYIGEYIAEDKASKISA